MPYAARFPSCKIDEFLEFFSVFTTGVDWGIPNPYCVSVLKVNSFQTYSPQRGWKQEETKTNETILFFFPNLFPSTGMETIKRSPEMANLTPFQTYSPQRGWKP